MKAEWFSTRSSARGKPGVAVATVVIVTRVHGRLVRGLISGSGRGFASATA